MKGEDPKVCMYLNRVTQDVNDEDIVDYLETKTGIMGEFIVKEADIKISWLLVM